MSDNENARTDSFKFIVLYPPIFLTWKDIHADNEKDLKTRRRSYRCMF